MWVVEGYDHNYAPFCCIYNVCFLHWLHSLPVPFFGWCSTYLASSSSSRGLLCIFSFLSELHMPPFHGLLAETDLGTFALPPRPSFEIQVGIFTTPKRLAFPCLKNLLHVEEPKGANSLNSSQSTLDLWVSAKLSPVKLNPRKLIPWMTIGDHRPRESLLKWKLYTVTPLSLW